MTDLQKVDELLVGLPKDPAGLVEVVQGLVLHRFWAEAYGVVVPERRESELQVRSAKPMIEQLIEIGPGPLGEARPAEKRFLGNCRHFATLTTALFRRSGVPARARCGFANYFDEGKWVDHWVVEYWNENRWVTLDAQIDAFQHAALGLRFDPADLPTGCFLTAGDAWLKCRYGVENADQFGILDMWGKWFIRGNIARDLASLNKVEMLPWDGWGTLAGGDEAASDDGIVDAIATLILSEDLGAIRLRYESDPDLRVPSRITSYLATGPVKVHIPELEPQPEC